MKPESPIIESDRLHAVQREILHAVVDLCNHENITYFTLGGTTLGAVRESGFIKWDDDIDIGMMRSDYERFIQLAPKKLPSDYILMHYSTEPKCYTYFAKVMKTGTRFEEDYCSGLDVLKGIYIDVKPIDLIPNNRILQQIHWIKVRVYEQLFLSKVLTKTSVYNKKKNIFYYCKSLIRPLMHCVVRGVSRDKLFCLLDNCVKKYNNHHTLYASFRGEKKTKGLVKDYTKVMNFKFDNLVVAVPCGYKNLLTNQFGKDYMIPVRKETGHSPKIVEYE